MPRRLQVEFSGVVQQHTDATGAEVTAQQLWQMFNAEYVQMREPLHLHSYHLTDHGSKQGVRLEVEVHGHRISLSGEGNGPIDAAIHALRLPVSIHSYEERALGLGADARASAIVEIALDGLPASTYGAGIDANIVTASIQAIFSGANRLLLRSSVADAAKHLAAMQAPLRAVA
ncbi:2-isopropylmalate synthase [mine drainage metagenome]|uniref:2-isopropylmalate synthase n=1 Tax=mine drainage metagenome TaxID=410659 RepID=A0A1J5Q6M1_9ZZZZ